ncbi:MAG: aldolase/citrate lyase family protein [Thermodesulfobacteriota bacterium]
MKKNPVVLFVPGNRQEFLGKAARFEPDAVIIDLEDAVAISSKQKLRREIAEVIPSVQMPCIVRVNNEPQYLKKDLAAVAFEGRMIAYSLVKKARAILS